MPKATQWAIFTKQRGKVRVLLTNGFWTDYGKTRAYTDATPRLFANQEAADAYLKARVGFEGAVVGRYV